MGTLHAIQTFSAGWLTVAVDEKQEKLSECPYRESYKPYRESFCTDFDGHDSELHELYMFL